MPSHVEWLWSCLTASIFDQLAASWRWATTKRESGRIRPPATERFGRLKFLVILS